MRTHDLGVCALLAGASEDQHSRAPDHHDLRELKGWHDRGTRRKPHATSDAEWRVLNWYKCPTRGTGTVPLPNPLSPCLLRPEPVILLSYTK